MASVSRTAGRRSLSVTWSVERSTGSAAAFHARELAADPSRAIWVLDVIRPAIVLGSTQPMDHVDLDACRARHVDVVQRRSGGGAVLLEPLACTWIDVIIPRRDQLWSDDVGHAAIWLGESFGRALVRAGADSSMMGIHRGRLERRPWSAVVCFAGLGPGEVTVGGRKIVGISQRRTRTGARFQTALMHHWQPERLLPLLAAPKPEVAEVADVAIGVGDLGLDVAVVVVALLDELSRQ